MQYGCTYNDAKKDREYNYYLNFRCIKRDSTV